MSYDPRRVRTRVEVKGRPHPVRSHSRVERLGNLSIGLFGGEHADLFDKRGRSTTQVRRRERQWTLDLTRRAAAPADGDLDYVVADQGDILDEQPQHPLAVARRCARIIPDTRQVGDQRGHPFLHLGSDRRGLGFACTRIRVFGFGQPLERLVPVAFQVVGDEPILGPHEQELPLRQLGVFAKPRDLRSFGAIDLGGPGPQLVEHLDGHIDRCRGDGLEHEPADRMVDCRTRQPLARRLRAFNPPALTDIAWRRVTAGHAVAHRHAVTAPAADDDPLQQGHAFTGGAASPVRTYAPGALEQCRLIGFKLFPGDVARVGIRQKDRPLLAGEAPITRLPGEAELSLSGPPIDVRSGIAGIGLNRSAVDGGSTRRH